MAILPCLRGRLGILPADQPFRRGVILPGRGGCRSIGPGLDAAGRNVSWLARGTQSSPRLGGTGLRCLRAGRRLLTWSLALGEPALPALRIRLTGEGLLRTGLARLAEVRSLLTRVRSLLAGERSLRAGEGLLRTGLARLAGEGPLRAGVRSLLTGERPLRAGLVRLAGEGSLRTREGALRSAAGFRPA